MADASTNYEEVEKKSDSNLALMSPSSSKQRVEPVKYSLYTLFLNYLLHRKIPTEEILQDAGMTSSTLIGDCKSFASFLGTKSKWQNQNPSHSQQLAIEDMTQMEEKGNLGSGISFSRVENELLLLNLEETKGLADHPDPLPDSHSLTSSNSKVNVNLSFTLDDLTKPKSPNPHNSSFSVSQSSDANEIVQCDYDYEHESDDDSFQIVGYAHQDSIVAQSTTAAKNFNDQVEIASMVGPLLQYSINHTVATAMQQHNKRHSKQCKNSQAIPDSNYEGSISDIPGSIEAHSMGNGQQPKEERNSTSSQAPNFENNLSNSVNNLRKLKFLAWAKNMYVKVTLTSNGKDFQVVSLMSKKSNKEIAPTESFEYIIHAFHSQNNQLGIFHLSLHSTVAEIKKLFTVGRRDFGMTEEIIRRTIAKCDAVDCICKVSRIMNLPSHSDKQAASDVGLHTSDDCAMPATRELGAPVTILTTPAIVQDKFYEDIAQVISEADQHLKRLPDALETNNIKKNVASIKKSGNSLYHARALKRRFEDSTGGPLAAFRTKPVIPANPVESMSLESSYNCLGSLSCQMRKELLVMYAGERRHHDSLNKSLQAAQLIVRRCQTLNRKCTANINRH